MRLSSRLAVVLAVSSLSVAAVRADILPLTLTPPPDISSVMISSSYTVGTGAFTANGIAQALDLDATAPPDFLISGGTFALSATINNAGHATAGTLAIGGTVNGNGPSLLTGTLVNFGQSGVGSKFFDFIFQVTGGSLAGLYGGVNSLAGVVLNIGTSASFGGGFTTSFTGTSGAADTAKIPAPSSVTLAVMGAIASACLMRRTRPLQLPAVN